MSGAKPRLRLVQTAAQLEAQRHAANNASAQMLGLVWYRQYPATTLSIARGWPMAVLGVYHALHDLQWDCASLPADPDDIRRMGNIQPREWRVAWPLLGPYFPIDVDGRRRNPQLSVQRYDAVGKRWQQIDAINTRHHPDTAYPGASADTYLRAYTGVATSEDTGVRSDEVTHQHQHKHQLRNAYQGGNLVGESLRSTGTPSLPEAVSLGKRVMS